jgi:hypothetical protein
LEKNKENSESKRPALKCIIAFFCFSHLSYILTLEGSVGGLLKTFTDTPAPHPLVILGDGGHGSP